MKNYLLLVILALILTSCNSATRQAQAAADTATREWIRSQVYHTYNLIKSHNDLLSDLNKINKDTLGYVLMNNIDTASMLIGIDKLKGDKLYERQKEIESQLDEIKKHL